MAQDFIDVRRDIADDTVTRTTRILDDLEYLELLAATKASKGAGGDYTQSDFDGTDLKHLNPTVATGALDKAVALLVYLRGNSGANGLNYFLEARRK